MYKLPDYKTLLPDYPMQDIDEAGVGHNANLLEAQLDNFGVKATVVDAHAGPVITQYELKLAKGVKAAEISNLSTDLAIALKAKSIRILTPIPGKGTIGIEIPNKQPHTVFIKDVLEHTDVSDMKIPLVLGKSVSGGYKVMDLTKAPHLLIAGQTGSGKSVGVNVFINSILSYKKPDEVKMILIDPKMVELKPYENVPHVIGNIITEPKIAVDALKWTVGEMDRRYKLLSEFCVRNIDSYNEKYPKLPYIVVIIDELADLMMTTGKQVEEHIVRIAQKARAVGIHLILTTQRPDVKVITGLIKSNLPSRIGFKVASQIDAKIIMDGMGCEKLIGNGDMLFRMTGMNTPERIHGAFISDEETKALIGACVAQQAERIHIGWDTVKEPEPETDIRLHPKYDRAVQLVKEHERFSASFLQRWLDLNHNDSQRMIKIIKDL